MSKEKINLLLVWAYENLHWNHGTVTRAVGKDTFTKETFPAQHYQRAPREAAIKSLFKQDSTVECKLKPWKTCLPAARKSMKPRLG